MVLTNQYCVCELVEPQTRGHLMRKSNSFGRGITYSVRDWLPWWILEAAAPVFLIVLNYKTAARIGVTATSSHLLYCRDVQHGKINNHILWKNLDLAIDTYISFVNKAPCGSTVIHLYKGADSTDHHIYHENLKIFLKGSQAKKKLYNKKIHLCLNNLGSTLKTFGSRISTAVYILSTCLLWTWLPTQFVPKTNWFIQKLFHWFPNEPPLSQIPLPVVDPARSWGEPLTLVIVLGIKSSTVIDFKESALWASIQCYTASIQSKCG